VIIEGTIDLELAGNENGISRFFFFFHFLKPKSPHIPHIPFSPKTTVKVVSDVQSGMM